MQCHLGLRLSLRRDFALDPLTRSLAGEHAYKDAQRFVAMIARCNSSHSASMLPTALISRPDHNAPFHAKFMSALRPSPSAISPGGHQVIARQLAQPQARSSPPARKGRSEAEWLDGAEDRRTISRRDGRPLERR